MSTSKGIILQPLMAGHRFGHFRSGDKDTDDWLHKAPNFIRSRARNRTLVLANGPLVYGFVTLSRNSKRLLNRGFLEIVALGVDVAEQRNGYGRVLLALVEQLGRSGELASGAVGMSCRPRTSACEAMLRQAGFVEGRLGGYLLRF